MTMTNETNPAWYVWDEIRFEAPTYDAVEVIYDKLKTFTNVVPTPPLDVADAFDVDDIANTPHFGVVHAEDPELVYKLIAKFGGTEIGAW